MFIPDPLLFKHRYENPSWTILFEAYSAGSSLQLQSCVSKYHSVLLVMEVPSVLYISLQKKSHTAGLVISGATEKDFVILWCATITSFWQMLVHKFADRLISTRCYTILLKKLGTTLSSYIWNQPVGQHLLSISLSFKYKLAVNTIHFVNAQITLIFGVSFNFKDGMGILTPKNPYIGPIDLSTYVKDHPITENDLW